jgi:hypothetical protein
MSIRTCISPKGKFIYGIHQPSYDVDNFRQNDMIQPLGHDSDGRTQFNEDNYPADNICIQEACVIYEIPNAFPFKGTTFIKKQWADKKKGHLTDISLTPVPKFSWMQHLSQWADLTEIPDEKASQLITQLPEAIQLTIALQSDDSRDLVQLAKHACAFTYDNQNQPTGLKYQQSNGRPIINNPILFEALANNPNLPDHYKLAMVLRPGAQGISPIVGEYSSRQCHVYEYLRANSYIPWGHFAANMADDNIRYDIDTLTMDDMTGMRHLYYQRTYVHLARQLHIPINAHRKHIPADELEKLRILILDQLKQSSEDLSFDGNLWGWNFGAGYAPNHYRLHASHQQIHQQYAMIPSRIPTNETGLSMNSYACGDLVADFITDYRHSFGCSFFDAYVQAIQNNQRMDDPVNGPQDLIIYSDTHIMIFVPKAQTSQWEIQIMPTSAVGNILMADLNMRESLDRGIFMTAKILSSLNAQLVTHIEYASRFCAEPSDQRLIIAFLPRMPESPGAFSEAQLRWINGHYPEDFAAACRLKLPDIIERSFS